MPTYEYKCITCEIIYNEFRIYEERDWCGQCDLCHQQLVRAFTSAPGQLNVALPDGTKRKGFSDLKEASKLNELAMDSRPAERKRLEAEVKKLTEVKK